jgi:hypothetical protein
LDSNLLRSWSPASLSPWGLVFVLASFSISFSALWWVVLAGVLFGLCSSEGWRSFSKLYLSILVTCWNAWIYFAFELQSELWRSGSSSPLVWCCSRSIQRILLVHGFAWIET